MDTNSFYMGLPAEKLEDVIKPELKQEFDNERNKWLAFDKNSKKNPGLFKLEFDGFRAIALCSKSYYVDGEKKITKNPTKV